MKPLLLTVALLLLARDATLDNAKHDNTEIDPKTEHERDESQTREGRCTSCSASATLAIKSPNDVLAAIHSLPGAEVHSQSSFEGCSSDKGCAGIKVKDGQVVEKYGDVDAFKAAAAADTSNQFSFHTAGNLANVLKGGVSGDLPFWWMGDNSPFKNAAAGGNFQKFSKSSSSSFSTGGSDASVAGGASTLDLSANPFLNGQFAKGGTGQGFAAGSTPGASKFQSSSFESSSSSFSSSKDGQLDLSNNPFLTGKIGFQAGGSKFGIQGSGFVGSTPGPFTASTAGSGINLIQGSQKNRFEYTQQGQGAGGAFAAGTSGFDVACSAPNYECVSRSQCIDGVINTNGVGIIQSRGKKTQCNSQTEVCCRVDTTGSAFGQSSSTGSAFSSSDSGSASQGAFVNSGSNTFSSNSGSKFGQGSFGASQSGSLSGSGSSGISGSNTFGVNSQSGSSSFGVASKVNSAFQSSSSSFENRASTVTGSGFGSTLTPSFGPSNSKFAVKGSSGSSQTNYISSDSNIAGSESASVFRPGAPGTVNKPGIPYLPPVDSNTAQSFISSTAIPPTPPYVPPRPSTTPRPTQGYLPPAPSTSAPGYLPPVPEQTIQTETRIPPSPTYVDGSLILDATRTTTRPTPPFVPNEIPAGCAAALKCTPIEYCTAEGVISTTVVILSKDQESYRVPLTDCKSTESGVIGKCCRDPNYSDPWPANLIGKWAPGVFGGNDGKYTPDNAGSPNILRPQITARPPVTGSTILPNFRKEVTPFGPNQVTPGFGPTPSTTIQKGQYEIRGQGQYEQKGEGRFTVGGEGKYAIGGQGQIQVQGQGGSNQFGQGQNQKTFGQGVIQGGGQIVSQGFGTGVRQGQGIAISQGSGYSIEEEYALEARLFRVLLQRYTGSGECGILNGQKPYGDKNELEVDFAEIPWQAMVLLNTNRTLLCGGVITRPDVVITSASCVEGLLAKNVMIKGGEWKLAIDDEPLPFQIVQVKHILRHPEYRSGSFENDVAILVLTENLRLAKNIWPICLPGARDTYDSFYDGRGECIVTGWGKQVLQAHLSGSIMHSLAVSLLRPEQCQSKLSQEYPHLLSQYSDTCVCGQPSNPVNNICKVDTGSALACTTGDGRYVLRGVYDWDSGCQPGNQIAAFYKFDLEWYEWAIGVGDSARFAQYAQESQNVVNQINKGFVGSRFSSGSFTTGSGVATGSGAAGTIGSGVVGGSTGGKGFTTSNQFQQSSRGSQKFASSGTQGGSNSGSIGSGIGETGTGFTTSGQFQQSSQGFTSSGGQRGIGSSGATGSIGSGITTSAGAKGFTSSGQFQQNSQTFTSSGSQRGTLGSDNTGVIGSATGGLNAVGTAGVKGFKSSGQFQQSSQSFASSSGQNGIGTFGPTGTVGLETSGAAGAKGFTGSGQFQQSSQGFTSSGGQLGTGGAGATGIIGSGIIAGGGAKGFTGSGQFQQSSQGFTSSGGQLGTGGAGATGIIGSGIIAGGGAKGFTGSGQFQQSSQGFASTGGQLGTGGTGATGITGSRIIGGGGAKGFVSSGQFQQGFKGSQTFTSSGSQGGLISSGAAGSDTIGAGSQGLKGFTVSGQFQQGSGAFGASGSQRGVGGSGILDAGIAGNGGKFEQRTSESFVSSGSLGGGSSGLDASSGSFQKGLGQFSSSGFSEISAPVQNTFSATYSEKKFYKSEPKIEYFTTKPEIVTFTTKPEIFTYTTKPKIITYTTKPQIFTYETSGSGQNTQYVAAGSSLNPTFGSLVGHNHNSQCKCLENGKK